MEAKEATLYRSHTCNDLRADHLDQSITLSGWVHNRRDHGGVIFVDLRDRYGLTQIVFDPTEDKEIHEKAEAIRSEWVLQVEGTVRRRPEGQTNPNMDTGEVEVLVTSLKILNKSETPPFPIDEHAEAPNEELRLEYRYLDLRRKEMAENMRFRHRMINWTMDFFNKEDFTYIETPQMAKGTPEGSREYIIPSRVHPGEFYVLPQAPQQFKQMLMLAGFDKYYQMARCFRDEDLRGDRQPEFVQLDVEMSFVGQEDILKLLEKYALNLTKDLTPEKTIKSEPIPRMTWDEAMNTYGSDKPDIRYDLPIQEATPLFEGSGINFIDSVIAEGHPVKALRVEGGASFPRSAIDKYVELVMEYGPKGMAFLIWDEDGTLRGSIAKLVSDELATKIKEELGAQNGDIIFFIAHEWEENVTALGVLRQRIAEKLELIDPNLLAYCFVLNFPVFEKKDDGSIQAAHHPFTMPFEEHIDWLTDKDKRMEARAYCYDLVLNGTELGGGSVRIHEQELQKKMFEYLELNEEEIQRQFGHILKAFKYGVPPHAGFALGYDRFVTLLGGHSNIKEMIAFPKTLKARDLMFHAPTPLPENKLTEAHIKLDVEEE